MSFPPPQKKNKTKKKTQAGDLEGPQLLGPQPLTEIPRLHP